MLFDPSVLKHAPWSISKVGVLELCARQFQHKYVDKIKEVTKGEAGRVGTSVHTVYEYGLKNPTKDLEPIVEMTIANDKLTTNEENTLRGWLPAVEEFVARMERFKAMTKAQGVYTEHKLGLSQTFRAVDFFDKTDNLLRGVIDYAVLSHDGVLIIIDHKSGKKKKIEEHGVQLNAYRIMGLAAFPQAQAVQCAINYVGMPKLDWAPHRDGSMRPYTRAEVEAWLHPWLAHYLNKQARKLEEIDAGNAACETGWQCEWCGYATLPCDAGLEEVNRRRAKRGLPVLDL